MNRYATKKLRLWTTAEDNILRKYFYSTKHIFSSHDGSRFLMLKHRLESHGFFDRTEKSISRRTYRLGLKSYIPDDTIIITKCCDCSIDIIVKKRYFNRKFFVPRCNDCQDFRNRKWDREHYAQKLLYCKDWRKQRKGDMNE